MRLLEINLATRPFRNNTLYWVGFGSAALILLAVTSTNLWLFFHSGSSVQEYQQETVVKQQKRQGLAKEEDKLGVKLAKLDFNGLRQQADFANDAIRRRIFSWTQLFNRLEEVVPPTVMMTALRPEIQAEGISVAGEGVAKDQEALLDFEEGLIRSEYFARIYPGSERREQRGGELHFQLKFDYLPEGRPGKVPAPPPQKPSKPADEVATGPGDAAPSKETPAAPPAVPNPAAASPAPSGGGTSAANATKPPAPPAQPPPASNPQASAEAGPKPASPTASGSSKGGASNNGLRASPAPGTVVRFQSEKRGRPMLHPGMGVSQQIGTREMTPGQEARLAEAQAAGNFTDKPLEDVIAYLTKNRAMTFIFDGSFDLRQKVTMDVYDKEQLEITEQLAAKLGAIISREAENTWRVSPKPPPPATLEEPPVDEEPAPDDTGDPPPPGGGR